MAIRDSIVGAIQSGQMAVGSALTGGGASVGGASVPLLEDLRGIARENEGNTERLTNVLANMFAFDKQRFARERDQSREVRKEKTEQKLAEGPGKGISGEDLTGGLGAKGIAAIAALAFFAKELGMNTDILKLPQQLKSIKGMATFAKGVGTIATFGLGPKIIDDMKAAVKATKVNPKAVQQSFDLFDDAVKTRNAGFFGKGGTIATAYTKTLDSIADTFNGFKKSITANKMFVTIADNFKEAKTTLQATFKPVKDALTGAGGLFASAKQGGALAKLIEPIKTIGRSIGKLFLPLTIILGIFDGVAGFTKEYEETGSIVDGIRGAVVGIVDGFIGSFVRLITDLVGMALEFLGLKNLGKFISDFGEDITKSFGDTVGGLVDFVMGIFTLDLDRILGGLGTTMKGVGSFLFDIVFAPVNMAINFIKDIFGLGDPEEPFSLKDFFFGEDGPLMTAFNFFKEMFTIDFQSLKQKLFDMGTIFKGLAMGGVAAAKAILPGGESPGEAFKRVFDSYTKGQEVSTDVESGNELAKMTTQDIEGNTTETTYKTSTIDNSNNNNEAAIIYNDQSTKQVANTNYAKNETYTGMLNVGIDPYFDRYNSNIA